jgi:hypothetical protein
MKGILMVKSEKIENVLKIASIAKYGEENIQ